MNWVIRFLLSVQAVLLLVFCAQAQDDVKGSWEGGAQFGISQYYGDVSSRIFSWKQKGLVYGVHARYNHNSKFSGRISLTRGKLRAADSFSKSALQRIRNIDFKTNITEFSFVCEYNILGFSSGSKRKYPGMEPTKFSPYVFAGFDVFLYSPRGGLNGSYYKVKTLDTELGKNYKMLNLSIPFGAGVKYSPLNLWTLSFDLGMRKTFTDYLDDVSGYYPDYNTVRNDQGETAALLSDPSRLKGYTRTGLRGNPKKKDWYLFMTIGITKKLYFKNY